MPAAEPSPRFVHLHVHSEFSLLDGACRIPELIRTAKAMGMPAVALSDHGNMFGAIEFYAAAVEAGVKPIIGCELYIAPGDRRDRTKAERGETAYHLLLLASSNEGYRNLVKLSSIGYTEGFYYKPRIDLESLRAHAGGLICTSTCLGGMVPQEFLHADYAAAKRKAELFLEIFGPDRFFVELQNHGLKEQLQINPELADLARKLGVATIATNDVHYLTHDDVEAHDVLCCISTRARVQDENRFKFETDQFYFKSPQEMAAALPDYPEALANTLRVVEMCNVEFDFSKRYAPRYEPPQRKTADEYLRELVYEGAAWRYGHVAQPPSAVSRPAALRAAAPAEREATGRSESVATGLCAEAQPGFEASLIADSGRAEGGGPLAQPRAAVPHGPPEPTDASSLRRSAAPSLSDELRERIDYELSVIADKGFSGYFLIVWDFVKYCREHDIPCNARGSGCSTVVGYCLGISNVDPLHYGLYFERFMDPERDEMPDIDIDMCMVRRAEVIDYVREKYGHVAQIITFGRLKPRAAIRDVSRALDVPLAEADQLAKLVPEELKMTIDKALSREPELKRRYDAEPQVRKVLDIAQRLEGLARHASVHAAGVVIADQALDELIPLYKPEKGKDVTTQFEGPTVEKVGLLKMDFLGLRTLSQIHRACELVAQHHGIKLDLEQADLTDQRVYEILQRGETRGIFQFESGGMRDVLLKMKPNRIEDLIAANALFRPGPMEYIDEYVARKHGRAWTTPHPIMTEVLEETYGIMVYQEQVSRLVNRLGNVPLRRAFRLAKAISKKKEKMIEAERGPFLDGAVANGVKREVAEQVFADILKFGGYAFNKAHSTGYARVAFDTAYLKTYYPVEFMAAVLTYESSSTEKVAEYLDECRRIRLPDGSIGIPIKPPSVNESDEAFTVVYPGREQGTGNREQGSAGVSPARNASFGRGEIRFGLAAIAGLGHKAIEAILAARRDGGRFRDIFDFCERVDLQAVNRAVIEALIKAGAFDDTGAMRKALMQVLDAAIDHGAGVQRDKRDGQMSMFGGMPGAESPPPALPTAEWSDAEMLAAEKATLGFYITRHPLTQYEQMVRRLGSADTQRLRDLADGTRVVIGGLITKVRSVAVRGPQRGNGAPGGSSPRPGAAGAPPRSTPTEGGEHRGGGLNNGAAARNGSTAAPARKMLIAVFEDFSGSVEMVIFPDKTPELQAFLRPDMVVFVEGTVDRRREEPSLRVARIVPIEEAPRVFCREVIVRVATAAADPDLVRRVFDVCNTHRGPATLYLQLRDPAGRRATIRGQRATMLELSPKCVAALAECVGADNVLGCGPRGTFPMGLNLNPDGPPRAIAL